MWSERKIQAYFDCNPSTLERLMAVQQTGLEHGRQGWYPDSDYSSDADWCYGIGSEIAELERELQDEGGSVFDLYCEAHGQGLNDYDLGIDFG